MKLKVVLILASVGFLMSGVEANAVLISQGVTYDLQVTSGLNTSTANFNLRISGINGTADTERVGTALTILPSPYRAISPVRPLLGSLRNPVA